MSTSPNNAGLELVKENLIPEDVVKGDGTLVSISASPLAPETGTSGREALQALLAFSSLHEQIRQRRLREKRNGRSLTREDDWQLEQFVLDEVLQLVAERAVAVTGADGIAIALAEGDAIICRASAGSIAPDAGMRLDPNAGFSGECLVSGRVVRCDDVDSDARVNLMACRRLGVRSMVAVPLSAKQSVIGLLEAFSSEAYGFNDSDVRSLNLLSELILSAMRPEEEDRLAEISQRVVHSAAIEPEQAPAIEPGIAAVAEPELSIFPGRPANLADSSEPIAIPALVASTLLEGPNDDSEPAPNALVAANCEVFDHSRPGLAVVFAVVVFAVALGAGVWWTLGQRARSVSATPHTVAPAAVPARRSATTLALESQAPAPAAFTDDEADTSPATMEAAGLLPEVTAVRHWSSGDSSTVVIDIQDQVQYEAHRLPNPERIYLDLHDTRVAAELSNRIISIDDALLRRVRVAQPMVGVTRVVLETKSASDFSVSLEPHPYRLVVEVHKPGSKGTDRAKIDLFAPMDQAAAAKVPPASVPPMQAPVSGNQDKESSALAKPIETVENHTPALAPKLRVVLDAGHGGWDLGTVGRKGLLEKDLVLDIVDRLGHLMESRLGAEVIYTRKDDNYLPLEKRAEIANLAQAKLFVSVHANYSDFPSARGVETYYSNTYSSVKARTEATDVAEAATLQSIDWTNIDIREKVRESRRIAASVQHSLYAMLSTNNPGLPNRGVKEAHYVVLTGTAMPAILAEVSFVSSPTDENNLQSSAYRQHIAEALYNGIARYEASNRPVKMASAAIKPARR